MPSPARMFSEILKFWCSQQQNRPSISIAYGYQRKKIWQKRYNRQPMPLLGKFCLLFALVLATYCFVVGIIAVLRRDSAGARLGETARRAGMATFFAAVGAALALVWAALANDFSVAYIFHHSNRALPILYKIAVHWSGPEGSILF